LLVHSQRVAHPSVIRLQDALLRGKRHGVTEITGLGAFTWQEIIALVDILLGMVWTHPTLEERTGIWLRYEYESLEQPGN
jgi:hypothetical protein